MKKLPEHISYSSFTTWQDCGWKYYLTKVEGIKEGHAVWFTGGSAVHLATEYFDKENYFINAEMSLDEAYLDSIWNKAWFEMVEADEAINGDMKDWKFAKKEDMTWWYGEGRWMLGNWAKFRAAGWNIHEDFVEKAYEIPLDDTFVKMAIDRVMVDSSGKLVLLDIKTGASSQKHPLQLAVYAWALEKNGVSVDRAGFWDARTGTISYWSLEPLYGERIEDIFNAFDKARKESLFLPNLNNCGRCDVISSCKWLHK